MSVKRDNYLEWQEYFMSIAFLSAQRSKDPKTQVGACIVNKDHKIVGIGYNGMPIGCSDDKMPWNRAKDDSKESWFNSKSPYVCHAELNAVLNKNQADVRDCTIYVALFPCNMCAQIIIQSGIKEVIYYSDKYHGRLQFAASRRLLETAGVKYRQFRPRQQRVVIQFDTIEDSAGQDQILPTYKTETTEDSEKGEADVKSTVSEHNGCKNNSGTWDKMSNNNNIVKRKKAMLFNHAEQQNLPENIGEELLQNIHEASPFVTSSSSPVLIHFNFIVYSMLFLLVVIGISWFVANSGVVVTRF